MLYIWYLQYSEMYNISLVSTTDDKQTHTRKTTTAS